MEEIVCWLNINQGFAMTILTLVYVITTIVIVIYNRKSIKEIQTSREEESRPYIFAYLNKEPRDTWFSIRVKNYGKNAAKIENIEILPNMNFMGNKTMGEVLNNITLAPNQMLQFILNEEKEKIVNETYEVTIKYSPTCNYKKKYQENYSLIMQYSKHLGYTDRSELNTSKGENALINIANHLDSIRSKI